MKADSRQAASEKARGVTFLHRFPDPPAKQGNWSESALRVLRERYLARMGGEVLETPEGMCWRVAAEIAAAEETWGKSAKEIYEVAARFYELMVDGFFLPNSPTLMNAGRQNGLQYSACYVLPVGDSMEEIFGAVKAAAIIHKSGGGTGFAFSRLRPKDATVRTTGGKASGPVSFLRVFNGATEAVKQGGTRRGANMGILRVDHPDILEFIESKLGGGITNFNISVAATERFMQALRQDGEYELITPHTGEVVGRLRAKEVFDRIVKAAWRTGDPGLFFVDRCNAGRANPTPTLAQVEATNPCVAGDTLIYTVRGLVRADELARSGEAVDVVLDSRFDAGEWGPAGTVFQTGVKAVYRLVTEEGYEVRLTADHRLMTPEGWLRADALRSGDFVHIVNRKGGFGSEGSLEEGCLLGWLIGDGHIRPDKGVILRFYGQEKRELAPLFAAHMNHVVRSSEEDRYPITAVQVAGRDQATVSSVRFARRVLQRFRLSQDTKLSQVPLEVLAASEDFQRGFLQALFTADGHISGTLKKGVSIRLTSISLPLLKGVQRMLLNFGIISRLYANRHPVRTVPLPNGKGGVAEYECQADHDLVISRTGLTTFAKEIGFLAAAKQDRLVRALGAYTRGPYRETFVARVKSLEPDGVEPVFDLTEPLTQSFVANGFVAHNCGEQPLYPNEACNLGSVNLAKFFKVAAGNGKGHIDWDDLERVVRLSVRFLDDVIEANPYPLSEIDASVKANRRVGLGVMGWADLLFELGVPYDSEEALTLATEIMRFIEEKGHDESARLADERGPFPNWPRSIYGDERPLRNSTVTTIAPTGTISILANCSSGIEPVFALAFSHIVGDRHLNFINPIFERLAKARGFFGEDLMKAVAERGTVRGLSGIPEEVQRVFVTAHEVETDWHVRMQAAFQQYTDNGVSKTINLPQSATEEDVAKAYLKAYELGCIGITVFRDGCKGDQVLHVGTQKKGEAQAGPTVEVGTGIEPRPAALSGKTYRMQTPVGTAFVTVNDNGKGTGEPFEVFVSVGKAGSETMAHAEAIGRLISLILRLPLPEHMSARDRVAEIVGQLSGIGGGRPLGFGRKRVLSLPDALAQALAEHIGLTEIREHRRTDVALTKVGDLCPDCQQATLVNEEGCRKCYSCGFSEC
ncbi:MAG: LAGLIDADG family homing endonuclease [Candidatus Methylomirabilales bacterium]